MNFSELIQGGHLLPAGRAAALALALFTAVWWKERRFGWPALAAMTLLWAGCHMLVNPLSYVFPPREVQDWLLWGSLAVLVTALVGRVAMGERFPAVPLTTALLAAAAFMALFRIAWVMDRAESPGQRSAWTAGIIATVILAALCAEKTSRRAPPSALLAGLCILAVFLGLGLWQLAMPGRITARLLAVAGLAAGATAAALLRQRTAAIAPGMTGWMAGGMLLLFLLGCLSRASGVPHWPMFAAAAAIPLATLASAAFQRVFAKGGAAVFVLSMTLAGAALLALCVYDRHQPAPAPPAAAETGADDTGAYD